MDSEYNSDGGVGDLFRVTSPPMYPPPPPMTAAKTQSQMRDSVMSQGTQKFAIGTNFFKKNILKFQSSDELRDDAAASAAPALFLPPAAAPPPAVFPVDGGGKPAAEAAVHRGGAGGVRRTPRER